MHAARRPPAVTCLAIIASLCINGFDTVSVSRSSIGERAVVSFSEASLVIHISTDSLLEIDRSAAPSACNERQICISYHKYCATTPETFCTYYFAGSRQEFASAIRISASDAAHIRTTELNVGIFDDLTGSQINLSELTVESTDPSPPRPPLP